MSVSARLHAVALLLLAALAVQAIGSLHVAGSLRAGADHLVHDSLDALARARAIQESLSRHRHLVESAAVSGRADETAKRDSLDRLRATLLREAAVEQGANADAALRRVLHDLLELDLTGSALMAQARLSRAMGGAPDAVTVDPADPARTQRVFAVAADRIGADVLQWRQDRWAATVASAERMFQTIDHSARLAAAAGFATAVLGLLGLLVLRGQLGRLGGITDAVLRLARHDRDIPIPGRAARGPIGDIARAVAILAEDVRELERRGIAQTEASQLLDAALNSMTQGLATTDAEGRLRIWNQRFAAILALPPDLPHPGMALREALSRNRDAVAADALAPPTGASGDDPRGVVVLDRALAVRVHWVRMIDGGWLGTFEDISHIRHHEARLAHLARHDPLTDLPNRTALREAIAQAAAPIAVLSVNLDRFRTVNESLGHEAGDALLRLAAERLRRQIRAGDVIARIGADSFAIVQTAITQSTDTAAFASRVIEVLSEPYLVGNAMVVVGASVGIALPGPDPVDADALLRNADLARQHARQDGGGAVRFFTPEMDTHAQERRLLELDLRQALERDEFELHYQPLVSVRSRRICAFEALLRWHHADRGMVRPDAFIPLAEEVGLIVPIGAWVLARACAEAAGWPEDVGVAVNLSPVQFVRDGLVEQVQAAIAAAGIAPQRLELEITERVLLRDNAATLATLHRLRALGVRISMDDFGTGYSSLSYLRSFPFDKIKIDKSFVQGLDADDDGAGESEAIVRAIAGLGHSLGIATTAEGVETVAQLNALVADGCTEMQGYLFSPPRPAGEVRRLLSAQAGWPGTPERAAARV